MLYHEQGATMWLNNICVLCPVAAHGSPPRTHDRDDHCRVLRGGEQVYHVKFIGTERLLDFP